MEKIKKMFALEGATDSGLKSAIESMSNRKQILVQLLKTGHSRKECAEILDRSESMIWIMVQEIQRDLHSPYWIRKMGLATTPLNDHSSVDELGLSKPARTKMRQAHAWHIEDVKLLIESGQFQNLRRFRKVDQAEVLKKLAEYEKRDDKVENYVVSLD